MLHFLSSKEFIEKIRPKAIGQEILKSISPGQMIVKIVYDELVNFLGEKNQELNLSTAPPACILLVGLQGSGKTTSAVKLAKLVEKKFNKKVFLVSSRCLSSSRSRTAQGFSRRPIKLITYQ